LDVAIAAQVYETEIRVRMSEEASLTESFTWSVQGHPIRISCPAPVLESIRQAAWEGLQKVPRRGLEIGGVLFGTREGDEIRIAAWRPIPCEHAKGPGFELSAKDEADLKQLLESAGADPGLEGLEVVGWFHSHTRDGVTLTKSDLDLYNRFFPAPWQVALVVRPHAYEPARAGFFFREPSGAIHSATSYKEFILEAKRRRWPVGFDAASVGSEPPKDDGLGRGLGLAMPTPEPTAAPEPTPAPPATRRRARSRWLMALGLACAAAAGLFFTLPLLDTPPRTEALALKVRDAGDDLLLEWNRACPLFGQAASAALVIEDGGRRHELALAPHELETGSLTYSRESGEVVFRLTLTFPNREPVTEMAHFVGAPPAPPPASPAPEDPAEIERLQAEINRLRSELAAEAARTRKLLQEIQTLEKRLKPGDGARTP
jgi:proteasome lid subunit RPN8/RPN11